MHLGYPEGLFDPFLAPWNSWNSRRQGEEKQATVTPEGRCCQGSGKVRGREEVTEEKKSHQNEGTSLSKSAKKKTANSIKTLNLSKTD